MRICETLRIILEMTQIKKLLQKGPRKCSCCSLKILDKDKNSNQHFPKSMNIFEKHFGFIENPF